MNREQKIKTIQAVKSGMPLRFALNLDKYQWLYRNQGGNIYYSESGEIITETEREKYLPDAVIAENVSKQFRYGKNGFYEIGKE